MKLTTDQSASSYGQPVLVAPDGTAYGASDAPNLFGQTPAEEVNAEMQAWKDRVVIALGFGPWQATAKRMWTPYDPELADKFCRLGGIDTAWVDFARGLERQP